MGNSPPRRMQRPILAHLALTFLDPPRRVCVQPRDIAVVLEEVQVPPADRRGVAGALLNLRFQVRIMRLLIDIQSLIH